MSEYHRDGELVVTIKEMNRGSRRRISSFIVARLTVVRVCMSWRVRLLVVGA
jgi:hypothetical protein